jgi:RNA polymerase sigma-70 factor (ECF subfamily)
LPEAGYSADPAGREAVRRLYAVLDQVGDRARVLFVLRFVEQLELVEMSEALGCSLATVKRRLAKASQRVLVLARREPALAAYCAAVERSSGVQPSKEGPHG